VQRRHSGVWIVETTQVVVLDLLVMSQPSSFAHTSSAGGELKEYHPTHAKDEQHVGVLSPQNGDLEEEDEVDSLESMDSGEETDGSGVLGLKRKASEDEYSEDEDTQRPSPLKGIFSHALLQGVAIPDSSGVDWRSITTATLTTTRTTPRSVEDAIDRNLRSGRPSASEAELADRYGCIRLVVRRRVEALRSAGVQLLGLRHSPGSWEASTSGMSPSSAVIDEAILNGSPPISARELARRLGLPNPGGVCTRVRFLRDQGLQTKGILPAKNGSNATRGQSADRGANETEGHSTGQAPLPAQRSTSGGKGDRALRPFTAEEDAAIVTAVWDCEQRGCKMPWAALDAQFGRHVGACRQRWKSRTIASLAAKVPRAAGSRGSFLWISYQQLTKASHLGPGSSDTVRDTIQQVQGVIGDMLAALEAAASGAGALAAVVSPGTAAAAGGGSSRPVARFFTAQEDEAIVQLVRCQSAGKVAGARWDALDKQLKRAPNSCRSRWVRVLSLRQQQQQQQQQQGAAAGATTPTSAGPVDPTVVVAWSKELRGRYAALREREVPQVEPDAAALVKQVLVTMLGAVEEAQTDQQSTSRSNVAPTVVPASTAPVTASWSLVPVRTPLQRYSAVMDVLDRHRGQTQPAESENPTAVVRLVLASLVQALVDTPALAVSTRAPAHPKAVSGSSLAGPPQGDQAADKAPRAIRHFTAEEDALILRRVQQAKEMGGGFVAWAALSKELKRTHGSVKQRWRVLGPRHGITA
jgi:hypothetical protein